MSKKLGIKGHPTRGNEIIELLEMMGGINKNMLSAHIGDVLNPHVYFLEPDFSDNRIVWYYLLGLEWDGRASDMMIFTLEEFLEKFPFKVGDKAIHKCDGNVLTIKSMEWSEDCETMVYDFKDSVIVLAAEDLKSVNDTDDNHTEPSKMKNVLAELLEHIKTTPKEELEREFEEIKEWSNVGPTVEEFMTFYECVNKKLVYPKTYDECCKNVLGLVHWGMTVDVPMHYSPLIINFTKLLICHYAYCKIAGVEMGLGKPWEPDWSSFSEGSYPTITKCNGRIVKTSIYTHDCLLAFPTEKMRDVFYENFKDLIEQCKELL